MQISKNLTEGSSPAAFGSCKRQFLNNACMTGHQLVPVWPADIWRRSSVQYAMVESHPSALRTSSFPCSCRAHGIQICYTCPYEFFDEQPGLL